MWAVGTDCAAGVVGMCIFIDSSSICLLMGNIFLDVKIIGPSFHAECTFINACIGMCWNSLQYCKFKMLDCWAVMPTKMVHFPV